LSPSSFYALLVDTFRNLMNCVARNTHHLRNTYSYFELLQNIKAAALNGNASFRHFSIQMAPKRKAAAGPQYADSTGSKANKRSAHADESSPKKVKSEASNGQILPSAHDEPPFINRKYYPTEMSNERCKQYNDGEIPRPIEVLENELKGTAGTREAIKPGKAVLFWYKRDLRLFDNRGLELAATKAKKASIPLICLYIVSPEDYEAHCTSPARVDFDLRTLEVMKKDLAELDIPLVAETVSKQKDVQSYIIDMCEKHDIKHVYCNIEYEVDELRREAKLVRKCLDKGISFTAVHDDLIVAPGKLFSGTGKPYAVYSPWFRSWIKYVHSNAATLVASEKPGKNPASARKDFKELFSVQIPSAPKNKTLSAEEKKRMSQLWPAGEHEAQARLKKFVQQKISDYGDSRNFPAGNHTAMISVHHSAGTLNPRTTVRAAREANTSKALDGGKKGVATWVSEVAWRDFYKHVMANWPYVCMAKPFKYEYTNVQWEYNDDHFEKWIQGKTGFPIGEFLLCFSIYWWFAN
jgi:deoxyribodipyrimidine photo-lyase